MTQPSTLAQRQLARGEGLSADYEIEIADLDAG